MNCSPLLCGYIYYAITDAKPLESCLTLCTLWTVAHQAPLSMGFSRQEYWSGFPFPLQGIFPTRESNPCFFYLLYWQADSLPVALPGFDLYILYISGHIILYFKNTLILWKWNFCVRKFHGFYAQVCFSSLYKLILLQYHNIFLFE